MKMKKLYINRGICLSGVLMAIALLLQGCAKLDLAPRDRYSELTFWETSENVNSALNNVYNRMYNSGLVFDAEGYSDNAYRRGDAIATGNFTPSNGRFIGDWGWYYGGIKATNIFLENVDKNKTLDPAMITRMKAEARFVRAWLHFNLTKWWGDVPLISKDISIEEAKTISRTPKAEVISFILNELDLAYADLPKREAYGQADLGRITKGTALALKSRVLLYQGDRMAEVVSVSEQLMNQQDVNGNYSLAPDYTALFSTEAVNKTHAESMLAIQYVPVVRTWGFLFDMVPLSAGARTNGLAPSQELVDSYIMLNGKRITEDGSDYDADEPFKNRDPRLHATIVYHGYEWTNPNGTKQIIYIEPGSTPAGQSAANEYSNAGQGSQTGYYWAKYWDPKYTAPGISSGNNIHLIRWAEVLLNYAEAKEAQGQMTKEVWDKTIKPIRQRAGFTDPAALEFPGGGNLREIIRNERRSEFALEGLRIDDIRRWKTADDVLEGYLHGAAYGDPATDEGHIRVQLRTFDPNKHYLWPIPPEEIGKNPNLTQNPNY